jgi:glyoxylase-like metal-dependent hydrolase (beta-lactamase superfamily II)
MSGPIPTVLPDLFQLPLPTPFAVGTVNVFILLSDPLTLIDSGVDTDESFQALTDGLHALGHRVEDIGRLVITHHHVDHLGAAQRIVALSSAIVVCHPYTVPYLETPHAQRERNQNFLDVALTQAGVPAHVLDIIQRESEALDAYVGVVDVTRTIDEGTALLIGGRSWQVVHTPGHAGGMICLFDPASGVLLASDQLLAHISSNAMIEAPEPGRKRPRRLLDYMESLRKIAALDPTIAYTGHGEPIPDVRGLVQERLDAHHRRAARVLSLFEGQPHTLYEITRQFFPNVPETESFLTLSEVLGHIDLLETEGKIIRDPHADGIMYWKPAAP